METPESSAKENLSAFQLALFLLSLVLILALIADASIAFPTEVSKVVQILDLVACGLFFCDFCNRFYRAESKLAFMKWGWIDLLACIPNIDALRIGRMVRVLRILRLLRGVRIGHRVISLILRNKPKSAFASVLLTSLLLGTFSSIAILIAEDEPEANIKTAEDAIWWSVTTMTTVGYGDKYPVTTEGRIIAAVVMCAGVGLFGTLSGLVASFFLGKPEAKSEMQEVSERLKRIEERLAKIQDSERK